MSDCRAFSPLGPKETGHREYGETKDRRGRKNSVARALQLETQSSAKQKREINYQPAVLASY